MWGMMFASGLQAVASANADKADGVAPEEASQRVPNFDGQLPTPQQLLEMLDSLTGISDEEKATLREELLRNIQEATGAGLSPAGNDMTTQTMILLSLLALVALIFENILESLVDKGLLSENVQEKLLHLIPENSRERLSSLFQRYQQLDEEKQHEILNQLVGRFKQTLQDKIYNETSLFERLLYSNSYTIFFFALLFVILILVFFVYKLFKCLSERQIKREEKKKIKQMKKKK